MMLLTAALLLAFCVLAYTLFVRPADIPPPAPVSPTQHLEERKAQVYENLRDLQFEYRVGKLSDVDYQQTKVSLQSELAGVLAEIDRVTQTTAAVATKSTVAKASNARSNGTQAKEAEPSFTCPHCGARFAKPMKFCGECGKAMAGGEAA